ncbi:MAG: hypothetical protein ABI760_19665 [Ferruginibacter sp.]
MKQFKFLTTITFGLGMAFILHSCGSGGDKKADEPTTDTTAAVKAPEPALAPEPAKPGNVLIIQHKVANFIKWRPAYESHDSVRRAHGLTNYILGRGLNDSNMVVVILKMDDVNKAKELGASPELKTRMQKGGVIGKPTITYLDVVMNDQSPIEQTARLMVTHKVKDWDAWKKEFDDHKQARMDAGLIDRGLGYSDGDNHMVSMVFAVTDMQKALAFTKSADLKDKMTKAGVDGPPTFLFYNIVQKY